jgi:hypothetical protein
MRETPTTERQRLLVLLVYLATHAVQRLVLEEDHRVFVANRGLQEAACVGGGRGDSDEQPRHLQEHGLKAVRMGWAELVAGALWHPHHEWHTHLAAEHVVDVGGVVDDLVEGEQGEVDGHQLDNGAKPHHRGPDAHPHDCVLGDRGVAHAPLAELLKQA